MKTAQLRPVAWSGRCPYCEEKFVVEHNDAFTHEGKWKDQVCGTCEQEFRVIWL